MYRQKSTAVWIGVFFFLLWVWPFVRAFAFYHQSRDYLRQTGSVEAARDVDFSLDLIHSYAYSLGAALLVAWCFSVGRKFAFSLSLCGLLYAVYEVFRFRPEEPIVFFPVMQPYRPAFISFLSLLGALAFRFLPRRAT